MQFYFNLENTTNSLKELEEMNLFILATDANLKIDEFSFPIVYKIDEKFINNFEGKGVLYSNKKIPEKILEKIERGTISYKFESSFNDEVSGEKIWKINNFMVKGVSS